MRPASRRTVTLAAALVLRLLSVAEAHGHDEDMNVDMGMGEATVSRPTIMLPSSTSEPGPPSYFQYEAHSGLLMAHILLMTIGWVFILPIGVMFSISRSRYSLLVQFIFLSVNAMGVLLVTIYNASTPDLYPNNAHHKLGWILTWVISAQAIIAVISAYTGRKERRDGATFIPISTEVMAEHQRMQSLRTGETYRFSNDSGQGTEPNTESLRSLSISSTSSDNHRLPEVHTDQEEDEREEKAGLLHGSQLDRLLSKKLLGLLSSRVLRIFQFLYNVVDRVILLLAFTAVATGFVTYGGLFIGPEVFSGLAHFIKGGVFFWYGILTLGRWAGCFADIGWAWNIKPSRSGVGARTPNQPTAEFAESFLIFFYGSTNVFLEHLAAWGNAWSAQDLEHISITIMFIGGGLCGMLIESKKVRNLLNTKTESPETQILGCSDKLELFEPKSYRVSMNPIPALIVLLLGLMMSSHHQASMISSMIHKQWGTLLVGAAFARAATYIIFYLAPPTSILPGRPPSELITAFCLMAGGVIFMASSRDIVTSIEAYGLDAMFVFTVAMGVITFLMAWIILVIAIKGWAVKKENRDTFTYHSPAVV